MYSFKFTAICRSSAILGDEEDTIPIDRMFVAGMILHPQVSARAWKWEAGQAFEEWELEQAAWTASNEPLFSSALGNVRRDNVSHCDTGHTRHGKKHLHGCHILTVQNAKRSPRLTFWWVTVRTLTVNATSFPQKLAAKLLDFPALRLHCFATCVRH